ncbi:MAG: peptidoglycan editing factor PgeF [Candidatus Promineifilaceae bacterium]
MVLCEKDGVVWGEFEQFRGNGRIRHAVFTRMGGFSEGAFSSLNLSVSVPDDKARVYANRQRAYGLFGRQNHTVVHAHLVHGNVVARVTAVHQGALVPRVDGLVTDEPGTALTMNFADCAPIFLYDPVHHAIGLGHAGWKGAVADLPGAMVRAMVCHFGSRPYELLAGIGPAISVRHYEVDEPVISAVRAAFAESERLLVYGAGQKRPYFDLVAANVQNLRRAGVEAIETSGLCTHERTDLFFSHRAENGRTGRFGTIFVLDD